MPHFVIMGSGRVGVMLARTLEASGHTVAVSIKMSELSSPYVKGSAGSW